MAMEDVLCKIGLFFVINICMASHFSGCKEICQSDSHLSS